MTNPIPLTPAAIGAIQDNAELNAQDPQDPQDTPGIDTTPTGETAIPPITEKNTIQEWLEHPTGAAVMHKALARAGQDTGAIAMVVNIPLETLSQLSKAKISDEDLENMVRDANNGEKPTPHPWAGTASSMGEGRHESHSELAQETSMGSNSVAAESQPTEGPSTTATSDGWEAAGADPATRPNPYQEKDMS